MQNFFVLPYSLCQKIGENAGLNMFNWHNNQWWLKPKIFDEKGHFERQLMQCSEYILLKYIPIILTGNIALVSIAKAVTPAELQL